MIDLDGVERDCASAIDSGDGFVHLFSAEDVMDIIARLRQAEKDAARYRWLRDRSQVCVEEFANTFRRHRDSFADEAMQCK